MIPRLDFIIVTSSCITRFTPFSQKPDPIRNVKSSRKVVPMKSVGPLPTLLCYRIVFNYPLIYCSWDNSILTTMPLKKSILVRCNSLFKLVRYPCHGHGIYSRLPLYPRNADQFNPVPFLYTEQSLLLSKKGRYYSFLTYFCWQFDKSH